MAFEFVVKPIDEELFDAVAVIDEAHLEGLVDVREKDVIKDFLGARNEIWLGRPRVHKVTETEDLPTGEGKSNKLPQQEFFVQCSCSFRPAAGCEFIRASLRVYLNSDSEEVPPPIALDLFPKDIYLPVNYSRSFKIAPSVGITVQKDVEAKVSLFESEVSSKYIAYEPEIIAFGSLESEFGWDFNPTRARAIRGIRDLFFLLRGNPSSEIRFQLTATIRTKFGPLLLPQFINPVSGTAMIYKSYRLSDWIV